MNGNTAIRRTTTAGSEASENVIAHYERQVRYCKEAIGRNPGSQIAERLEELADQINEALIVRTLPQATLDSLMVQKLKIIFLKAKVNFRSGDFRSAFEDTRSVVKMHNRIKLPLQESPLLSALLLQALLFMVLGADGRAEESLNQLTELVAQDDSTTMEAVVERTLPRECFLSICPNLSAMHWHSLRSEMIRFLHPEVVQLFENSKPRVTGRAIRDLVEANIGLVLAAILVSISAIHASVALYVGVQRSLLLLFLASSTIGAFCAYGIQALNHDLCHVRRNLQLNTICMSLSSALCNFPWVMYYREYHRKHHAMTGTESDRDGDILFQPWYSPPALIVDVVFPKLYKSKVHLIRWQQLFTMEVDIKGTMWKIDFASKPILRWLWTIIFAWGIYGVFHTRKLLFDKVHIPVMKYEGLWLLASYLMWSYGGGLALAYLWWSAAFSLGAAGHPYFGFWLIQHSAKNRPVRETTLAKFAALCSDPVWAREQVELLITQPTISSESMIWNAFNFGELYHVEHHDFPMIPALRYKKLSTVVAPEFYDDLISCKSIPSVIAGWVLEKDNENWMAEHGDFAGRDRYLDDILDEQRDSALYFG